MEAASHANGKWARCSPLCYLRLPKWSRKPAVNVKPQESGPRRKGVCASDGNRGFGRRNRTVRPNSETSV